MTVASGKGDWVADEGRKMPVAVFYQVSSQSQFRFGTKQKRKR